jgi:hypothetical protein
METKSFPEALATIGQSIRRHIQGGSVMKYYNVVKVKQGKAIPVIFRGGA